MLRSCGIFLMSSHLPLRFHFYVLRTGLCFLFLGCLLSGLCKGQGPGGSVGTDSTESELLSFDYTIAVGKLIKRSPQAHRIEITFWCNGKPIGTLDELASPTYLDSVPLEGNLCKIHPDSFEEEDIVDVYLMDEYQHRGIVCGRKPVMHAQRMYATHMDIVSGYLRLRGRRRPKKLRFVKHPAQVLISCVEVEPDRITFYRSVTYAGFAQIQLVPRWIVPMESGLGGQHISYSIDSDEDWTAFTTAKKKASRLRWYRFYPGGCCPF